MENSLKQRIIGALVLIALAVIFLPAILKEKANEGSFTSQIPKKNQKLENYQLDTRKIDDLIVESQNKRTSLEQRTQDDSEQEQPNDKPIVASSDSNSEASEVETNNLDTEVNNNTKVETPISETIGDNFTDAAWVVQVASFSNQDNAVRMVERLQKGGYKAYRRKVKSQNKDVYRVFVGPYIEKESAQKSLKKISQLSESDVIMKPFDPIRH